MRIRTIVVALSVAAVVTAGAAEQRRPPADLTRAGWNALNAGRIQDAADAFTEAIRQSPTAPALLGAAVVAHLRSRYEDARQHLVAALALDPTLAPASNLLGEVLYRSGDIDAAIGVYEQLLVRAPENAQVLKRLDAWRKESALHSGFRQRLGDHFTVLFEGPAEAALAERAVAILEAAYWRIGTALYAYPGEIVTVVLYTREQFRDITQSPAWAGAAFDGRIRVPVQGALQNLAEFERVLTHEFTHALMRGLAPRGVPTWLNEGLAMFFEGSDLASKREQVRRGKPLPLERLEGSFASFSPTEASVAYAQSAIAAARLMELAGAPAIANLLTDVGAGTSFQAAFARHIPISYEEFQQKLTADE